LPHAIDVCLRNDKVAVMDHRSDESRKTGNNLRRLMADQGLTVDQLSQKSAVDRRTIKGILDGTKRPQLRTIGRLAKGLEVASEELFIDPAQLLYRRFDRDTNPVVEEVIETHPEVFAGWTPIDYDELHSRMGTGGPLTAEGTLAAAERMNAKRLLHEKLTVLLESSQAEVIAGIVDLMYERMVDQKD
jgi:transcriptional regulator with XRE-family HTH domain